MTVQKTPGALMSCVSCDSELECVEFDFQGKKSLSWCDIGTKDKHFGYDFKTNKTWCKKSETNEPDPYASESESITQKNIGAVSSDEFFKKRQEQLRIQSVLLSDEQIKWLNEQTVLLSDIEDVIKSKLTQMGRTTEPQKVGMYMKMIYEAMQK